MTAWSSFGDGASWLTSADTSGIDPSSDHSRGSDVNATTRRNPVLTVLIVLAMVVALLPTLVATASQAGATTGDLVISGVVDGPLTGGTPKAIEVYVVANIPDLSIYGLGSANNGGGSDGEEFTFPAVSGNAGDYLYVATESIQFAAFFGFDPDFTSGSAPSINGDDAIELFMNGTVVDVFGDINQDGTGEPWDHVDGWAYRVDGTGQDGTAFTLANWTFSGPDALDGETTNATAATPFPIGTYSTGEEPAISPADLVVNEVDYDQPTPPTSDSAEFVEIKNTTGASIDLSLVDLVFVNGSGGGAVVYDTIPLVGTLAAGDYFVVCGDAANVANCDLDDSPNTNFIQNGAPDAVAIDFDGTIIDAVSYEGDTGAPYTEGSGAGLEDNPGDGVAGISRCADGGDTDQNSVDFQNARPITPGATNDCEVGGGTLNPGDLVINEIIQNPAAVSDSNGEWFEVFNNTAAPIELNGLTIKDDGSNTHTIGSSVIVPPGGFAVLGIDANSATNGGVTVDYEYSNFFLANGDDEVVILDGLVEIDRVNYDGGTTFPDPTGASMALNDTANDNNDGTNWCTASTPFGDGDLGTPGAANDCPVISPIGLCGDPATLIHDIQGAGLASPVDGTVQIIEGVVVGDFQGGTGLNGFFVQEEDGQVDGDALTSEGIFVFDGGFGVDVDPGDVVRVGGTVDEFFDLTEITSVTGVIDCGFSGTASATTVTLPVASIDEFETTEGMAVSLPQELFATGNFTQARFGEVDLSVGGPLDNPTNVATPGAAANAVAELNNRSRIQLDDGSNVQNPLPLPPYLGVNNTLRTGDSVSGISAVMSYSFGVYELQPTAAPAFVRNNARPAPPTVGGSMTVAAYNVLNYFTTIDNGVPTCGPGGDQGCRGADTAAELERQRDKIVAALAELDVDVVGLIEIENPRTGATPDDALDDLVNGPTGLNSVVGAGTYDYIDTGTIGTDAIKVALIYKPANVTPVGAYAILDSSVDPAFIDTLNRPVLAQTFQENGTDDLVTVAVNHLKSKGSSCDFIGDTDTGDGQGNCNLTRDAAAGALVGWLATDPTGSGSDDNLIVGDLDSYAMEDPITTIKSAGYTDLIELLVGTGWADGAYSFNFFSESGYLDHALASPSVLDRVTGAGFWHVNADEPSGLDYNNFNQPMLYSADPYRSSDHDPVVVGLCETTAPVVEVTASPDTLWPPNHKYREVTTTVEVTDADPNTTITLVSVESNEPDNGSGDGDTINDIVIVDDFNFQLRAERSGNGDGRVYTIIYEVTDACGNSTLASATVTVPKSKGKK